MTNTHLMEVLHNNAINQQTQKAFLIAMGVIAFGSTAFIFYKKYQQIQYDTLNRKHMNCINLSEARINDLSQVVIEKDNKIVEQGTVIKQLQDENIIFKNKIYAQLAKEVNDAKPV